MRTHTGSARSPARWVCLAAVVLWPGLSGAASEGWTADRTVDGIDLESQPRESGFRAYRGTVTVCADLEELQAFVGDASRFHEWLPYTEEARDLKDPESGDELYYLRNSAPWPLKSRDMVYRLTRQPGEDNVLRIALEGVPQALPPQAGAVRMEGAEGLWTLQTDGGRIEVGLSLTVNPGRAPAFFVHRRLAATVGGTLANLQAHFPCGEN
ncbi:MAG: hypothetical protein U5Q16_01645 [Gammaproteobacteria bacterium]|nr:hypothetical protein [Gammaproteobacteria bacterium]